MLILSTFRAFIISCKNRNNKCSILFKKYLKKVLTKLKIHDIMIKRSFEHKIIEN